MCNHWSSFKILMALTPARMALCLISLIICRRKLNSKGSDIFQRSRHINEATTEVISMTNQ
ncbi:hypothetical protein GALMADRAFT_897500 [Galerina marginata CBS 339.88]|uniref:Uncharacterized protein n=1 Tax=Galerina marginata (strain CBS 339.88) TaxID=685588 RepID=A0A067ST47_GALM3|nr:hypothetical protein GALMADRAFT_897500 [Galerina marginata CBS 339.88]